MMLAKKKEENGNKRRKKRGGGDIINDNDDIISDLIQRMKTAAEVSLKKEHLTLCLLLTTFVVFNLFY